MLPPLVQVMVLEPFKAGLAVKPAGAFMKYSTPLETPSLSKSALEAPLPA